MKVHIETSPLVGYHTHYLIDKDGTVKSAHGVVDKNTADVDVDVISTDGKLSQQQYTSLLCLITAMMLNYGLDPKNVYGDPSWEEIKRKG